MEKLEVLDDLVYEAIGGQRGSDGSAAPAWPEIVGQSEGEARSPSHQNTISDTPFSIW